MSEEETVKDIQLIEDNANLENGSFGIGFAFTYKGRNGRIAVRFTGNPSMGDVLKGWSLLKAALKNPEDPESKTAWDGNLLIDNEMKI